MSAPETVPTVFISYSHDSAAHAARVLSLSNQLREGGIKTILDQYDPNPSQGWPRWMDEHIRESDFVLMVCTPTYFRRVMNQEAAGVGLGVQWEGNLIYNHLYGTGAISAKFIPVLLGAGNLEDIPTPLSGFTYYRLPQQYEALYRRLTNQPEIVAPEPGPLQVLPPQEPPSAFSGSNETPEILFPHREDKRNRKALLGKVRHAWIEGVLKRSLWSEARLLLDLEERPEKVVRPYDLARREVGKMDTRLPAGKRIIEVYDQEAQGALLILGQPGSGKTTLLLEIAQALLDRADASPSEQSPIPVVFNLSTWQQKDVALDTWLVTALNQEYDVPIKIGQAWVKAGAILLLLDGLDEVAESHRTLCAQAINAYRQNLGGLRSMVVCCRSAEYEGIPDLKLHTAVEVLPLTPAQVNDYLMGGGEALSGIRTSLEEDETLQELMETPLMLSIITLTFAGRSAKELKQTGTPEERRGVLFEAYVERMFQRKGDSPRYPRPRALRWLSYLAANMQRSSSQLYLIENMQPDWLLKKWQSLIVQNYLAIILGLLDNYVWKLGNDIKDNRLLVLAIIAGLMMGRSASIETVDNLTWSWRKYYTHWQEGLSIVLGVTLLVALLEALTGALIEGRSGALYGALYGALIGMSLGVLAHGVAQTVSDRNSHPNEGIHRSLRSAALAAPFGILIGIILISFIRSADLLRMLPLLQIGTFCTAVIYGGRAAAQHYMLRLFLGRSGAFPYNITPFLDYCTDRIILQRVGGGWRFVHRLLLEHFAGKW